MLNKQNIKEIYPLSSMQENMLFHSLMGDNTTAYFEQMCFTIKGEAKLDVFEKAINYLVERHDILRTVFVHKNVSRPFQVVLKKIEPDIEILDASGLSASEQQAFFEKHKQDDLNTPFNLSEDVLMRTRIIRFADDHFKVIWSHHHILMDGWCMSIILEEFLQVYKAFKNNAEPQLSPVVPYVNYIKWLEKQNINEAKDHWKKYLGEVESSTSFSRIPESEAGAFSKNVRKYEFSEAFGEKLNALCRKHGITLNALFQASWSLLLSKYNYTNRVTFGSVVSGRHSEVNNVEAIIGLFINTIPVVADIDKSGTLIDLAKSLQGDVSENTDYDYLALSEIYKQSSLRSNLFDHILVYENYPAATDVAKMDMSEYGFTIQDMELFEQTNYNLAVIFMPSGNNVKIKYDFNESLYPAEEIEQIHAQFDSVLHQVVESDSVLFRDVNLVSAEEQELLTGDFCGKLLDETPQDTVITRFKAQAVQHPDKEILFHKAQKYTYAHLDKASNALAAYLISRGLQPGDVVGIKLPRGVEFIISMLGIMKAGGAYLPIDIHYPEDRIQYVIDDSNAPIVITDNDSSHEKYVPFTDINISADAEDIDRSTYRGMAYLIYTSGSTGNPKGVCISHLNVVSLINWAKQDIIDNQCQYDIVFAGTSFSFDLSVFEMFVHFSECIPIRLLEHGLDIPNYLDQHENILLNSVPSIINDLVENKTDFSNVNAIIMCGEPVPQTVKDGLDLDRIAVLNVYGPSEDTVYSTLFRIDTNDTRQIIGKPLPGTKCYVLDNTMSLTPRGVAGELCLSGVALSSGYYGKEEITKERFLPSPFAEGERIYRTGDLVRWNEDGDLEFLGRIDSQVKIRGHRIELGEIESRLLQIAEVTSSAVVARKINNATQLCAYITVNKEITTEAIKAQLAQHLPEYMIPLYVMEMDQLPLTPNGKIDKKALPEIGYQQAETYVAPRNPIEKHLAEIWQDVLKVEQVGAMDNFFDLGGDSIKAIQVSSRLKTKGLKVEIQDIFKSPVLEQLATLAVSDRAEAKAAQTEVTGSAPFTAIQDRWMTEYPGDKNHYNQSVMLHSSTSLKKDVVQKALSQLVAHHDLLRAQFDDKQQTIRPIKDGKVELQQIDVPAGTDEKNFIEQKANEVQRSLHIADGNLVRATLFQAASGSHLLIVIHHLVVDGVSWRILLEDFDTLYTQLSKDDKIALPEKTTSFLDWSKAVHEHANDPKFLRKQSYWFNEEEDVAPLFEVNANRGEKQVVMAEMKAEATEKLLKEAHKGFNTSINDVLIAALCLSLEKQFGKTDFQLLLEGHGRENILPSLDISRTVGWFTSEFPYTHKGGNGLKETLINTKERLRAIPNNGVGYGIIDRLTKAEYKEGFNKQQPQVLFNYLGQFNDTFSSDWFTRSTISSGDNQGSEVVEHALQANGIVLDGKLTFEFESDGNLVSKAQLEELSETFFAAINSLVELSLAQKKTIATPSDYGLKDVSVAQLAHIEERFTGIEKIYPLSPMQQGMLFVNIMEGQEDAYFEQSVLSIAGELSTERVEQIFNELIRRHEIIRSNVVYDGLERPLTVIVSEKPSTIHYEDVSGLDPVDQRDRLEEHLNEQKKQGFDLTKDMLMRLSVFKMGHEDFRIVWSYHHIIMDGWCLGILLNEFFELYSDGGKPLLPTTPYSEYIKWLEDRDRQEALDHWQRTLANYDKKAEVPGKIKKARVEERSFIEKKIELTGKRLSDLEGLARKHNVTVFNILQTLWGVLLQKYNSTDNAVFGSVVSGRPAEIEGVEGMIGLFINTIPVNVGREQRFMDTVTSVQNQFNESDKYNFLPLNEVQNLSDFKNELIDHVMIYESYPLDESAKKLNRDGAEIEIKDAELFEITNYDFTVTVVPGEVFTISFDYNKSVYDGDIMEQVVRSFDIMLSQIMESPSVEIRKMEVIDAQARKALLSLNPEEIETTHNSYIEWFNNSTQQNADRVALKYEGEELRFKELNENANRIANALLQKGIGPNDVVGIYTAPCFEMIEGVLGILKTGAAYLPVDIHYPEERIRFMLEDSASKALLYSGKVPVSDLSIPTLDIKDASWKSDDITTPTPNISKSDLGYIIYTSGSTGKPKGVMISQESFVDYVEMAIEKFGITKDDVSLQHASIAFDTTIEELYPHIVMGGCIVLPRDNKDFVEMLDHFASGEITYFCTSPLVLNYVNEENKGLGNLRICTVGGDELKPSYIDKLIDKIEIHNGYGPTESTVCATYYKVKGGETPMPIGTPFRNRSSFICNHDGNLLPKGAMGELCVGGKGLAMGYLNRQDLTDEKFVPNPYVSGAKMYKTGDLVRWNTDNQIEFFGRIDNQIQIRGFRVELGEVEAKLNAIDAVSEVAVLAWEEEETNTKFLCAYVVTSLKEEEILSKLDGALPEYMIPSKFVFLDKLPLTTNGKVDKKKLSKPEDMAMEIVEPENERQEILLSVWKDVLKKDKIGITNNFFSLGGDSIKAIQVASKVQQYDLRFDMRDLFAYPTVEELEPHLSALTFKVEQGLVEGEVPLTPIQQQFFEEKLSNPHHFNQALMLQSHLQVNEEQFATVLTALAEHHDALRTQYDESGKQFIHMNAEKAFSLNTFITDDEKEIAVKAEEIQASLNIYDGPLMAAAIFNTTKGAHVLLVIHHLVVDGISWRVILEDLETLLKGEQLPLKTQSFKSWSEHLLEYATSSKLLEEKAYWEDVEATSDAVWKYDQNVYNQNKNIEFEISAELTKSLLEDVNEAYNTEVNDILMATLAKALPVLTGRGENKIYLEGHGREQILEEQDISRTVGWFTSMYPVKLGQQEELPELIKNTKETLRKIPNKGIGYGILRYLNEEVKASGSLNAKPEIVFNYLGQYEEAEEATFNISGISTGEVIDPNNTKETAIDLNGIVKGGKLVTEITFNPEITPEAEIQEFIERFKLHLENIVQHCLGKEESEKTLSDYGDEELSEGELDDIMDMLDGI